MSALPAPIVDPEPDSPPPTVEPRRFLEKDGLRLLGLSRITRCRVCPRFEALNTAWTHRVPLGSPWPDAPHGCQDQICLPLVRRFAAGLDRPTRLKLAD